MNNCNNGFIFIFSDDKPIGCIFYNEELFEELGKRTEIGFDGTFYVVPSQYIKDKLPEFKPEIGHSDFEVAENKAAEEETGMNLFALLNYSKQRC